jgi:hypothetical protein
MTGLLQRPDPHRRAITVANVRFLWVIHTTADVDNADADVPFDLVYYGGIEANQKLGTFRFPDEKERARTDEYKFDVSSLNVDMSDVTGHNLEIEILADDSWLPSTIWVIGEDVEGKRELLVGIPNWLSSVWWSTNTSVGRRKRRLVLQP